MELNMMKNTFGLIDVKLGLQLRLSELPLPPGTMLRAKISRAFSPKKELERPTPRSGN